MTLTWDESRLRKDSAQFMTEGVPFNLVSRRRSYNTRKGGSNFAIRFMKTRRRSQLAIKSITFAYTIRTVPETHTSNISNYFRHNLVFTGHQSRQKYPFRLVLGSHLCEPTSRQGLQSEPSNRAVCLVWISFPNPSALKALKVSVF